MRWLQILCGVVGLGAMLIGLAGLNDGPHLWDFVRLVFGFLILGFAVLDYRRFKRGTAESELDGGNTIE